MTYYACKPWRQPDGTYRCSDTDGSVAFGDTEEAAIEKLKEMRDVKPA